MSPVDENDAEPRRRRGRDVWQLDIPLAVALAICISATVIEFQRAGDGNWRAGIYMFEWPLHRGVLRLDLVPLPAGGRLVRRPDPPVARTSRAIRGGGGAHGR